MSREKLDFDPEAILESDDVATPAEVDDQSNTDLLDDASTKI